MISFAFHAVLVLVLFYFAAREGLLGKKLNKIAVQMIKEKPPEKPKEPEKPKIEPPKAEPPKIETPKIVEAPPVAAPPVVAPPNSEVPSFEFGGGKAVETSSDPVQLYKGYMEYILRQKWNRPDDEADDDFVAEVAVSVDRQGNIENSTWLKGSGDDKWDATVKQVFNVVKNIDRPPPTNFPPRVTIRFDVQEQTEPVLQ
ncbi:MAG TPA: TonB C-terminal domain-containing protein [Verrucomicrobiae bacterium]|nr:TonB C-terminal domain-containing protein [Verrucomicrobiae bacterium]